MSGGPTYEAGRTDQFRTWRLSDFGKETDVSIIIDSTARDATATPTTKLREGLLLGKITASGRYKEYTPAASDGTETAAGILVQRVNLLNAAGTAVNRPSVMATVAECDEHKLLLLDSAAKSDFRAASYPGLIILRADDTP